MPELAVVLAYSKITLFDELLGSDVPEDPVFGRELARYFPEVLRSRYPEQIREHPLRREIIATWVPNAVVDRRAHLRLPADRGDGDAGTRGRAGAHGGAGDLSAWRRWALRLPDEGWRAVPDQVPSAYS
jgi:hypothetical protein